MTKKSKTRFSYLDLLTHFLNFDFGSSDVREIKKVFRDCLVEARFPPNQTARRFQTKLKQELLPIIAPQDRPNRRKAEQRLSRLVARINKIVFRPTWSVESVDDWEDWRNETFPNTKLAKYPGPVPPPVLKILGGTWYASKMPNLYHRGPLEHFLWWTVINAMENGELAKLKTCAKSFFSKMMRGKSFVMTNADMIFTTERGRNKAILVRNESKGET